MDGTCETRKTLATSTTAIEVLVDPFTACSTMDGLFHDGCSWPKKSRCACLHLLWHPCHRRAHECKILARDLLHCSVLGCTAQTTHNVTSSRIKKPTARPSCESEEPGKRFPSLTPPLA